MQSKFFREDGLRTLNSKNTALLLVFSNQVVLKVPRGPRSSLLATKGEAGKDTGFPPPCNALETCPLSLPF